MTMQDEKMVLFSGLNNGDRFKCGSGKYIKIPEKRIHGHYWIFIYNSIKEEDSENDYQHPPVHTVEFFTEETQVRVV